MIAKKLIFFFLFTAFVFGVKAQNDTLINDSAKVPAKHKKAVYSNAKTATIMSIVLPGLGQVYNKKYWKVPIIYAGFAGFGYLFYTKNIKYNDYRNALILSQEPASQGFATVYDETWSTADLITQKNDNKKPRDFAIIGLGIIYLLNIVDANVDGHLKTFDVSDDLSINIDPWQTLNFSPNSYGRCVTGLSVKFNFK